MSNINELTEALNNASALDKKFQEIKLKKLELDERKVNIELNKIHESEKELALAESANFGLMSESQIDQMIQDSEEYLDAAKNKMTFLDKTFDKAIPFFRKNIILIAGSTGDGKSTTVSNIIRSVITQKNPETDSHRTALVITNEQLSEDFFNSVTCQAQGWSYSNHSEFTMEQRQVFKKYMKLLAGNGLVTVIDNKYNGSNDVTTSIEGLRTIFDNLIKNKQYYDVVLIDYYQNFTLSKNNVKLNEYEVQRMFCTALDQYKNVYPAPIVIMAQLKPNEKDETVYYKYRLEGTKKITNVATCVVELIADRENHRTEWKIHKSRFPEIINQSYYTGYDKGKFVPYDKEFREKVALIQAKRQQIEMDKLTGSFVNKKIEEKDK